jgi:hypothetical protein
MALKIPALKNTRKTVRKASADALPVGVFDADEKDDDQGVFDRLGDIDMKYAKGFGLPGNQGLPQQAADSSSGIGDLAKRLTAGGESQSSGPAENYGLPALRPGKTGTGAAYDAFGNALTGTADRGVGGRPTTGEFVSTLRGGDSKQEEPQGLFEDLGDIDTRQERERQAFADELAARRAESMQQAEARAGLGGMGLSGATAELTSDIGRQEARAGDIAMADLKREQSRERFQDIQRQASIYDLEQAQDQDLDGDGNVADEPVGGDVGDGDPSNNPSAQPDVKEGRLGTPSEEQARKLLLEQGVDLDTVEKSSFGYDIAWNNTFVTSYTDDLGRIWKIYRRPDGTFFKQITLR